MHKRALKTFNSKYGLIRRGTIFQPEPSYAKALERNRLIEDATEEQAREAATRGPIPGPGETREDKSIPAAPNTKRPPGKDAPGKSAPKPGSTSAVTPGAGEAPSLSASDQAQVSRGKTLTSRDAGGKKSKPLTTPKRKRAVRQPANPAPAKPAE